jgi:hypothetical protein
MTPFFPGHCPLSAYQTNQLVNVKAFLPMGFENTDKKTAQEVPLLFQGSALILLYIQVRLRRYQPQGLLTGLGPRLTKLQHPWNSVPIRYPGTGRDI